MGGAVVGVPVIRLRAWLGGAMALVLAFAGAWVAGRREGRSRAPTDALRDQLKSDERGRNAAAKEKRATDGASDRELVDRLRARDGDWML